MPNKRLSLLILILILAMIFSLFTLYAYAGGLRIPSVSGRAAILYEPTSGEFVLAKNQDEKLPMASTTKIMTALLAIEQLDLDKVVSIPAEATGIEGSSVYLKEGDELTVRDLLYSVLLQSANDAAFALALSVSGDIKSFSELMMSRAQDIGAFNTSFENPHGLDSEQHYTTASDLALIAAEALKNETFKKICSTYKYSFTVSGSPRTVVNHNKLLKMYDGAIGIKTGYTKKCGRCLVSAAERNGVMLIAVTLDAPDDWRDHTAMLDYGFSMYESVDPRSLSKTAFEVPVVSGSRDFVSATVNNLEDVRLISKMGGNDFSARIELPDYIAAPINKGDNIGRILYICRGNIVAESQIVATESITAVKPKTKFPFSLF